MSFFHLFNTESKKKRRKILLTLDFIPLIIYSSCIGCTLLIQIQCSILYNSKCTSNLYNLLHSTFNVEGAKASNICTSLLIWSKTLAPNRGLDNTFDQSFITWDARTHGAYGNIILYYYSLTRPINLDLSNLLKGRAVVIVAGMFLLDSGLQRLES